MFYSEINASGKRQTYVTNNASAHLADPPPVAYGYFRTLIQANGLPLPYARSQWWRMVPRETIVAVSEEISPIAKTF